MFPNQEKKFLRGRRFSGPREEVSQGEKSLRGRSFSGGKVRGEITQGEKLQMERRKEKDSTRSPHQKLHRRRSFNGY